MCITRPFFMSLKYEATYDVGRYHGRQCLLLHKEQIVYWLTTMPMLTDTTGSKNSVLQGRTLLESALSV